MNTALLEETLAHIRDFPELHDQSVFFGESEFGVTACFAGRALLLSGHRPVMKMFGLWDAATDLLDLDPISASSLFSPANTREMLEHKVKDLLNGAVVPA